MDTVPVPNHWHCLFRKTLFSCITNVSTICVRDLASLLQLSSPQQTRWWTWPGRWTRCSWRPTPGRPWWPPPLRWCRRDIGEIWREKKKLESHLQVPSLLFSGTVSSLHLPSSMPFSFRGFSIEDSVLARLFLGVFVFEDIFFKFTGRGLMRVLLQCWFKHDCAISQAVCTWTVFVTQVALYFSSDNPHFIHAFDSLPCVLCLHQRDKRKTYRLLTLKTKPKNWAH